MKTFVILLFTALFLHARGAEEKGLRVRTLALGLFDGVEALTLRAADRDLGQLVLDTEQIYDPQKLPAREFAFGSGEGESFRALGAVALPTSGLDFILVFVPTETGYRAYPVRADDPTFRANAACVFNFTPGNIGITLGTARLALKPGQDVIIKPVFPEDNSFYQATFHYEINGRYEIFNNSRWPVSNRMKSLVIVFPDPATAIPTYRSISLRDEE